MNRIHIHSMATNAKYDTFVAEYPEINAKRKMVNNEFWTCFWAKIFRLIFRCFSSRMNILVECFLGESSNLFTCSIDIYGVVNCSSVLIKSVFRWRLSLPLLLLCSNKALCRCLFFFLQSVWTFTP